MLGATFPPCKLSRYGAKIVIFHLQEKESTSYYIFPTFQKKLIPSYNLKKFN